MLHSLTLNFTPEGVIVQNEDFISYNKLDFAQYTVDLEFYDISNLRE